jgi:thymidylate synthase
MIKFVDIYCLYMFRSADYLQGVKINMFRNYYYMVRNTYL